MEDRHQGYQGYSCHKIALNILIFYYITNEFHRPSKIRKIFLYILIKAINITIYHYIWTLSMCNYSFWTSMMIHCVRYEEKWWSYIMILPTSDIAILLFHCLTLNIIFQSSMKISIIFKLLSLSLYFFNLPGDTIIRY